MKTYGNIVLTCRINIHTTGTSNTAIGEEACSSQTVASSNTAVGRGALQQTTGGDNTGIGRNAGNSIGAGSNNTCLGFGALPSSGSASNVITLGNSSIGTLRCQVTSISGLSDERDKTAIEDLPIGLDFINTLRPRKFTWAMRESSANDGKTQTGFIAQELQAAIGSIDYTNLVMDDNPEKLEAAPANLIPIIVKAIKELSAKVTALETS